MSSNQPDVMLGKFPRSPDLCFEIKKIKYFIILKLYKHIFIYLTTDKNFRNFVNVWLNFAANFHQVWMLKNRVTKNRTTIKIAIKENIIGIFRCTCALLLTLVCLQSTFHILVYDFGSDFRRLINSFYIFVVFFLKISFSFISVQNCLSTQYDSCEIYTYNRLLSPRYSTHDQLFLNGILVLS